MANNIENVERKNLESEREETVGSLTLQPNTKGEVQAVAHDLSIRQERDTERVTYHEIPGLRHETRDVLKQLNSNIQLLEDVGGRLSFVLAELRGLIRK